MKIYQTLLRQRAENCIAATYNVDLPFFEYLVFEKLYARGCRNTAVLCDPGQYQLALADIPLLKHVGQRYLCVPCTAARAAFHPKIVLLTSAESGLLLLGSNNLSRSGLVRNLEVTTRFGFSAQVLDAYGRSACRWAYDYLREVAQRTKDPSLDERLERMWSTTSWLRQDPGPSTTDGCWLLHNLHSPIMDQLVEHWRQNDGTRVREAVIVSPYYDREAAALKALLRQFEPEKVLLSTQRKAPGLDPERVSALLSDSGADWSVRQPGTDSTRRLHAKVLALRTERGSWVLSGSPNFSSPALLRSASDGNAEVAVLRHEPDPDYATPFLAPIIERGSALELDWRLSEEPEWEAEVAASAYRLVRADFWNGRLSVVVEPELPSGASLEVALSGPDVDVLETARWRRDGHATILEVPNVADGYFVKPVSVQLLVGLAEGRFRSTRAVVNNRAVLLASGTSVGSRERSRIPENLIPEGFEEALELLETLNRLLAMDVQQLRGHRGISERAAKELEREEAAIVEEEGYDPEAHIVDEQPDPVYGPGGSDLYEDYYDRMTYEALLRAAGAAIYRPEPRSGSGPEEGAAEESEGPRPPTPPPFKDEPVRQDRVKRITRRFGHLVGNFERGVQDDAYMSQVPPSNFCEIFLVLTTLLRILWLSRMIPDANFLRLSERLFEAFLGDEQQPGGRALTAKRITAGELAKDESRLQLSEKSWLHLYLIARRAQAHAEDRLPVLAMIMRHAARELGGPTVLAALPPDSFAGIWRHSFSRHRHPVPSIGG